MLEYYIMFLFCGNHDLLESFFNNIYESIDQITLKKGAEFKYDGILSSYVQIVKVMSKISHCHLMKSRFSAIPLLLHTLLFYQN